MSIHPEVTIGHVHLTVSNLERSLEFYKDLLGFEITTRYGNSAVFLSAGGYHHHIGLNTWAGTWCHSTARRTHGALSLCDSLSYEKRISQNTKKIN